MIEIILDASQLNVFEACPRKWYYDQVLNLTTARTNPSLSTGSCWHEVLKFYYTKGMEQPPLSNHLKETIEFAHFLATGPRSIEWPRIKDNPKFFIDRIRAYFINYLYKDDTTQVIAVEKGFSTLLYEDSERRYILEGMIDLISLENHLGLTVTDHKTQQRYDTLYEYNHQLCNYLSFTGAEYFRYNYIGQQESQNANTFHRQIFKAPPGMLAQWRKDVLKTFQEMERFVIEGMSEASFPRRRNSCDTKYGTCQFHKICQEPDDSPWIPSILTAYKPKEKIWKAWS